MNKYGLLGIPFGACARSPGCSRGPATLRDQGLLKRLQLLAQHGAEIEDFGDTNPYPFREHSSNPKLRNLEHLLQAAPEVTAKMKKVHESACTPVIIGGDHSISIMTVACAASLVSGSLGLLWIDAHPDLCTPTTTVSGNIHGMSVAHLLGHGAPQLSSLVSQGPTLSYNKVVFIGLREVEESERNFIKKHNIKAYSMREIDQFGIGHVMGAALEHLQQNCDQFWLSFDLDSCDPDVTPGVGTPVRGGLSYREAHLIMEMVAESNQLFGLELVEYNPNQDSQGTTANMALGLLESALGKTIL